MTPTDIAQNRSTNLSGRRTATELPSRYLKTTCVGNFVIVAIFLGAGSSWNYEILPHIQDSTSITRPKKSLFTSCFFGYPWVSWIEFCTSKNLNVFGCLRNSNPSRQKVLLLLLGMRMLVLKRVSMGEKSIITYNIDWNFGPDHVSFLGEYYTEKTVLVPFKGRPRMSDDPRIFALVTSCAINYNIDYPVDDHPQDTCCTA